MQQSHSAIRGRSHSLKMVVGATVALVMLAGCASDSPGVEPTPQAGGTINIVQSSDIALGGWFSQTQPNLAIQRLIFNTLIEQNVETLEPQASLATSWDLSEDGTTISFELRDDVTFHDGSQLTSADVIASVETMRREGIPSQLKGVANLVTVMEANSDTNVTFTFARAATNIFDMFEMMPVIDDATVEKLLTGEEFNGTGPFVVDRYTPGQGMSFVRNDSYWAGAAPLDGVEMTVVRDSQSMLTALRSGDAQIAVDLAPLDALAIQSDPAYTVYTAPAMDAGYYIASNVNVPVLSDNKVRQAIARAIDRERILEQVLGGNGRVTSLPWGPGSPANDPALEATYSYQPEVAAADIKKLGIAGTEIPVYYDANNGVTTGIANVVVFDLEEAGLAPVAAPLQSAEFLARMRAGELDGLFINVHGFGQMAPVTLLSGAFPFNANGNASQFVDDTYKQLVTDLASETDPDAYAAILKQVNAFLLDQQFVSDLVATGHTYTMTSSLKGMSATLLDYPILDTAYLAD